MGDGVGGGLRGTLSGFDLGESHVHTADNHTLLGVVQSRADDDFVSGDSGLNGVLVDVAGKDNAADGRALETKERNIISF